MPGPITQEALDLLGLKISTAAEKAATVGAEVDEVREYVDLETAKLDARLDEHSRQRDADRATVATLDKSMALLQQSMDSVRKIGWAILITFITSAVGSIVAAVFLALTHTQGGRFHEHDTAMDPHFDRTGGILCRDRVQDDWNADRPSLTAGGGDRR